MFKSLIPMTAAVIAFVIVVAALPRDISENIFQQALCLIVVCVLFHWALFPSDD